MSARKDVAVSHGRVYARKGRRPSYARRARYYVISVVATLTITAILAGSFLSNQSVTASKPVILYVNQGNGVVNESNFQSMLSFAKVRSFNTIFFQVYREGKMLFSPTSLQLFVKEAHTDGLKIFFALYFTNSSQSIPTSIYGTGEDGISLDMSTLPQAAQGGIFSTIRDSYHAGEIAITTTDFNTTLRPNLLVLETYGPQDQALIHHGIIASVGVFATSSKADYQEQFQYALKNSDGVMVFDYARLVDRGY